MNIVVFGAGGVGGYFGGKLAQAGFNVTFVARGKHYDAIKNYGLKVKSIHGDFHVNPKVVNEVSQLNNIDLIILGVKSWQVKEVAEQLFPIVKENTMVLPLQNGADNADQLCTVLHNNNVLAGLCKIVSRIESPGVIDHFAYEPEIVFGECDNVKSKRIEQLSKLFDKAAIKNTISDNIHLDIWKKFLFIATVSGMGAITRSVFGVMRENDQLRRIMYQTANEIVAVANAKKIPLTNDHVELVFNVVDNLNYNTTASMQRDIMAGRPSELEVFNGYIVNEGKRLHVSTPVNAYTYYCLLPQEQKARKV